MNRKSALAFSLIAMLLASCSGNGTSSSGSGNSKTSSTNTSSSSKSSTSVCSISSSSDEEDEIFNRNDGKALEVTEVSNKYSVGSKTNPAPYDYDSVYVNQPTNTLANDFAWGVDCSSLYDVETAGGRFYDEDGKEADLFQILKKGGANYARFRLWVDPYDKNGVSYGGGTNDISHDIYLAKRAAAAGMKIMVNFHYSDSWVDPSKKWSPKSWMYLNCDGAPTINEKTQYKRVGEYTAHALNAFKNAGLEVSAVQIGNEVNNGMAGSNNAKSYYFAAMVKAGVETARNVYPNVKTIVHLANVNKPDTVYAVYNNLVKWGVDWDVCGLSYYPFWHEGRDNLQEVMNHCADTYDKEVMIVETSWGYTTEGASFCNNQYGEKFEEAGGYLTSYQAQASELAELTDCLSKIPDQKGTGLFYWEPAWLPLEGSGWITKTGYYYNDHGYDYTDAADLASYTDSSCYSSWANQAWFDYTGKALPSYKTYKLIQDGTKTKAEENVEPSTTSFTATYNLSDGTDTIPTSGKIATNLDRLNTVDIVWDETELASLKTKEQGKYTIHGKLANFDVTCLVSVVYNYIQDNSFENQKTLQKSNANEYAVKSPWTLDTTNDGVRVESKSEGNRTGTKYFHWWASSAFEFSLSQKLSNIPAGTYSLSTYVLTHLKNEYGGYTYINLFYQIGNEEKVTVSMLDKCAGYGSGLVEWTIPSIIVASTSDVTIGLEASAGATTWGHNDDWSFLRAS